MGKKDRQVLQIHEKSTCTHFNYGSLPHVRGRFCAVDNRRLIQNHRFHQERWHDSGCPLQDHRIHKKRRHGARRLLPDHRPLEKRRISSGCLLSHPRIHQERWYRAGQIIQNNRLRQIRRHSPGFQLSHHRTCQRSADEVGGILFLLPQVIVYCEDEALQIQKKAVYLH